MSGIENTRALFGTLLTPARLAQSRRRSGKDRKLNAVQMEVGTGKQLSKRQWVLEKPLAPLRPEQLAHALRDNEDRKGVLELLARIAHDGNVPRTGGTRQEILQKYLALHMAAGLLENTPEYPEWLLTAACMRGNVSSSKEALKRRLKDAEADESTFASLFESVVESHGDKVALRKLLFAARRNLRLLAAVLRQALGLNQVQAFRRREVGPEELVQDIVACGDNIGLLTALADSIEGLQGNPAQHAHTLRKLRGDAKKLAEFLLHARDSAGRMHRERDELRSAVHGAIREMELVDGDGIQGQYNAPESNTDAAVPELLAAGQDADIKQQESARFIGVLRRMLKLYDLADFNRQLGRTKSALGVEMRDEQRSDDKARRTDILNSMSSMHLSSSFLMLVEQFESDLKGIARLGVISFPQVSGKSLIEELLGIIESGSGQPSQFEGMLKRLGLEQDAPASIVTLQGVMGLLRTMPDQTYPNNRTRTQLQEAAQSVLENAILREEAAAG